MKTVWPWIFGIAIGLIIIALLFAGEPSRDAYWAGRGTVVRPVRVAVVNDLTMIRFPCHDRAGSIETAQSCAFYVWKK